MTNSSTYGKNSGVFKKIVAINFLLMAMAIASYAQSGNLYEARSNYRLGVITAYPNLWRIDMGNRQEIKIYSCRSISATGLGCVFTQFMDGRTTNSGEAQVYQNGAVNLRWTAEFTGNQQRNVDSGWRSYQVR